MQAPLLPYEDAEAGIADCVGAIESTLGNAAEEAGVTVVAHSISGLLLPSLAAHPAVNRVVYLAAAVAPAGMSFRDYYQSSADIYHEGWARDGARTREDRELARHYLYHDVGDTVFARIREHRIAFAARKLWTERPDVGLPPAAHCAYIAPSEDRVFRLPWMQHAASELLGVGVELIDAGHCPHLSRPRDVAAMLLGPA